MSDDFDLDSWIEKAHVPERTETVYGRADLVAEIQSLEADLQAARAKGDSDDRLGSPDSVEAIARRIKAAQEEMESSALKFRFRALPSAKVKEIRAAAPLVGEDKEPDPDFIAREYIAAASVSPKITPSQAQSLRDRLGEGQFGLLWAAAFGVTTDQRVSVPFSLSASAILSRLDSSAS